MLTTTVPAPKTRMTGWLGVAAGGGILWNAYKFYGSVTGVPMRGMTAEQELLYASLPSWITVVFAVGVFGGLAGSIALFARRSLAPPVLAVSLVAYVLLFAGDLAHGVFAAVASQLGILIAVVAIAAALLYTARVARLRGMLA